MHCAKQEEKEQNQYTMSLAHQLVMERKRIQDMELFKKFEVADQKQQMALWDAKLYHYYCRYLREVRDTQMNALVSDDVVINLAERTTERHIQNTEV